MTYPERRIPRSAVAVAHDNDLQLFERMVGLSLKYLCPN
jgi:hypothetical protein